MTTEPLVSTVDVHCPRTFREQFGNPSGLLGALVGWIMAASNRRQNAWVASLLDLRGDEDVLEVGFGPGVAVKQIRSEFPKTYVAGVELSDVMIAQARARNAFDPRIDLRRASVSRLPFDDESFDRVVSFNSAQFWSDLDQGLREIRRVLRPSGVAAIAIQPRGLGLTAATTEEWGETLSAAVARAGFSDVRLATRDFTPLPAVCALARA